VLERVTKSLEKLEEHMLDIKSLQLKAASETRHASSISELVVCCSVFSVHQRRCILLLGFVAGGAHVQPSLELLREPLLEIVKQQAQMVRQQDQMVRQQDQIAGELRESRQQESRQQDAFVSELRVTNTYLRNSACWQFKYTSSQATQHRDPNFKQALIEVRSSQCCKPSPPTLTLLLAMCT
jgi:hypothetical protein